MNEPQEGQYGSGWVGRWMPAMAILAGLLCGLLLTRT